MSYLVGRGIRFSMRRPWRRTVTPSAISRGETGRSGETGGNSPRLVDRRAPKLVRDFALSSFPFQSAYGVEPLHPTPVGRSECAAAVVGDHSLRLDPRVKVDGGTPTPERR
jgi:hypothetical protein